MAAESGRPDLGELLERVAVKKQRQLCWASLEPKRHPEEFTLYVDEVTSAFRQNPSNVNRSEFLRTLTGVFGVQVGREGVRVHLDGECTCG